MTIQRNARLYPIWVAAQGAYFWMPVFFLFFASLLPLSHVLLLEAVYYISVVLLEVPSGALSDRLGRRPTLITSAAALTLAHTLFALSSSFLPLALAQVLLAAGIAFNSGTDTSLHLDSLEATGDPDSYGEREARASRVGFISMAASAIIGGLTASLLGLRAAYALSLVAALIALGVALAFREPPRTQPPSPRPVRDALTQLRSPTLAWLFAFATLATVVNHIPYELIQPYLQALSAELTLLPAAHTPTSTGLHAALVALIASAAAGRSVKLRERFGLRAVLFASLLLQLTLIGAIALTLHPLIALMLLARSVPGGLQRAPLREAIAPRLPSNLRATYLSLQSLSGRLAYALTLLGLSTLADTHAAHHDALRTLALAALAIGALGALLLAAFGRTLASPHPQ